MPASATTLRGPAPVRPTSQTPDAPWPLRVAAGWAWRLIVLGVAVYLVLRLLGGLYVVVVAVMVAVLLAALLSPITSLLRSRLRLPRAPAALVTLLLVLGVSALAVYLVSRQAAGQFSDLQLQVVAGLARVKTYLDQSFGIGQQQLTDLQNTVLGLKPGAPSGLLGRVLTASQAVVEFLVSVLLTVFVLFFLLSDGARIWSWLVGLVSPHMQQPVDEAGRLAWKALTGYVRGIVLVALIDAGLVGVGLLVARVPLVLALVLLTFVAAFVPVVGATVAGAASVLVALVSHGPTTALAVLGLVLVVQQVEGHILHPLVQRRMTALHPLAVGLAVATGALLFGIFGALVAVPLMAVVTVVTRYVVGRRRQQQGLLAEGPTPHDPEAWSAEVGGETENTVFVPHPLEQP